MTTVEAVEEKLRTLPPELLSEVEDFIEFLAEKRRRNTVPEGRGWPTGYFEDVVGSLPDFPDVDDDLDGIDPKLDRGDDELRFDPPEQPNTSS